MAYLMGIDIGTYASKGVLSDVEGHVVAVAQRSHEVLMPHQGWAEHDAEKVWWGELCTLSQELIATSRINPQEIKALACSAIGPCLLPVDAQCRPLRSGGILYGIDTRAYQEIQDINVQVGEETIFERCANALSAQSIGPKLSWLKRHEPETFARAHKFLTASSFMVARLTGQFVMDHLTAVYWAPCYDFEKRDWHPDLCKGLVDIERLPRLGWANELAGTVTPSAARETGLAVGTPVTVGTADAPAEALSVGVVRPHQLMLMYGSTLFFIEVLDKPLKDKRLWATPYLFKGTSSLAAGMSTTGALTRWFLDQLTDQGSYERLIQDALLYPAGSEGLMVLPYFSGERTPMNDPRARGTFFGLTLSHTRGHMFRAVLEGIGYGIKQHLEIMQGIGAAPEEVIAVGGGTKNRLWLQIVSDVCGVVQKVPSVTIGASYGDAFLAGLATGHFKQPEDIDFWLKNRMVIEPDARAHTTYQSYYPLYAELYQQTRDIMHRLSELAEERH